MADRGKDADAELRTAIVKRGTSPPSERQLRRWYDYGLLGSKTRIYVEGKRGAASEGYPPEAVDQAINVLRLTRQFDDLASVALTLWSQDGSVTLAGMKRALRQTLLGYRHGKVKRTIGQLLADYKEGGDATLDATIQREAEESVRNRLIPLYRGMEVATLLPVIRAVIAGRLDGVSDDAIETTIARVHHPLIATVNGAALDELTRSGRDLFKTFVEQPGNGLIEIDGFIDRLTAAELDTVHALLPAFQEVMAALFPWFTPPRTPEVQRLAIMIYYLVAYTRAFGESNVAGVLGAGVAFIRAQSTSASA